MNQLKNLIIFEFVLLIIIGNQKKNAEILGHVMKYIVVIVGCVQKVSYHHIFKNN